MPKSLETMVREFHEKYGVEVRKMPEGQVPFDEFVLRGKLIAEESLELQGAMVRNDLVEIADAIADLIYVTAGTALTYGIPLDKVIAEVHRSNMTKTGEKREDGKILKGDYSPPQLAEILGVEGERA